MAVDEELQPGSEVNGWRVCVRGRQGSQREPGERSGIPATRTEAPPFTSRDGLRFAGGVPERSDQWGVSALGSGVMNEVPLRTTPSSAGTASRAAMKRAVSASVSMLLPIVGSEKMW